MSAWTGIAAAALGLALAFVVAGQPVWEWRVSSSTETETWSYGGFSVRHVVHNETTGNTTYEVLDYGNMPGQARLSAVFLAFGQAYIFALLAAFGGAALASVTAMRKLRGIFAGVALVAACLLVFYAALDLVIAIPPAATDLSAVVGQPVPEFRGQAQSSQGGGTFVTWGPTLGWFLLLGIGLAFAWGASDVWHVRPSKKIVPGKESPEAEAAEELPPPPPVDFVEEEPQEPEIEEVFVIAPSGLLVKHMSRSLMSDKDRDVVGGMISVVSNFVQEAFTERDGEVHEMTMGKNRFIMCRDNGVVIAALVGQGATEDVMHRIRHLLVCLLDRYGERITRWDGKPLEGIEDELEVLWEPFAIPPPPAD